jgi:hypothetical protein
MLPFGGREVDTIKRDIGIGLDARRSLIGDRLHCVVGVRALVGPASERRTVHICDVFCSVADGIPGVQPKYQAGIDERFIYRRQTGSKQTSC